MRLTTSHIHVECSKFVKQQLHNLAEYMHSNLTDKEVTSTIKRHFKSKVRLPEHKHPTLNHSAAPLYAPTQAFPFICCDVEACLSAYKQVFFVLPLSVLISYEALVTAVGDYMAGARHLEPISMLFSISRQNKAAKPNRRNSLPV